MSDAFNLKIHHSFLNRNDWINIFVEAKLVVLNYQLVGSLKNQLVKTTSFVLKI